MNVLIGQYDQFQGHEHTLGIRSQVYTAGGDANWMASWGDSNTYAIVKKTDCGTPRYGKETRPTNLTMKIWKRIN